MVAGWLLAQAPVVERIEWHGGTRADQIKTRTTAKIQRDTQTANSRLVSPMAVADSFPMLHSGLSTDAQRARLKASARPGPPSAIICLPSMQRPSPHLPAALAMIVILAGGEQAGRIVVL